MSGPSDKARFYLEQAVPQLQEFKEMKIFDDVRYHVGAVTFIADHFRTKSGTWSTRDLILNTEFLPGARNRWNLPDMQPGRSV